MEKVHWLLCKKFEDKWFSHQPDPVLENGKCKILWDFVIQTDQEIEHRRPYISVVDKEKRECKIISIAVPGDQNIKVKELEKVTKYQVSRLQVQKLWNIKATVIPIVIGALRTVTEEQLLTEGSIARNNNNSSSNNNNNNNNDNKNNNNKE